MKYKMNNLEYKKSPQDFSKNTQKELLQYAVGPLLYIPATHEKIPYLKQQKPQSVLI